MMQSMAGLFLSLEATVCCPYLSFLDLTMKMFRSIPFSRIPELMLIQRFSSDTRMPLPQVSQEPGLSQRVS